MKHSEYIKSDAWKAIRKKALERDNYTCQDCGIHDAKEVHHLTYDNFGKEPLEDLVSLCRPCHGNRHERFKPHSCNSYDLELFGGAFGSYEEMIDCEIQRIMDKDE